MKTYLKCGFKEFWLSPFCDDFCESNDTAATLASPKSKIIEDISESSCLFGPVCIFYFCRKNEKRFSKKMIIGSMEEAEETTVELIGSDTDFIPEIIIFTCGSQSFDFILSEEQRTRLVEEKLWDNLENYFMAS